MLYTDFEEAAIDVSCVRLIDSDNVDLHTLIKENMVVGQSLVFHRYHECGIIMHIRPAIYGYKAHLCRKVSGINANALFLYCCSYGDMPIGPPRCRNAKNGFVDKTMIKGVMALGWLAWQEHSTDRRLCTTLSDGEHHLG